LLAFSALLVAITAGSASVVGAVQNTCSPALDFLYTAGANFPQPVPPGNPGDDQLTVQLTLGAHDIQNGTTLNVSDMRFDLDCSDALPSPPCTDQGDIIEYQGDGTIVSDCVVGQTSVFWTSTAIGTNEIMFTPTPTIPIPANTVTFCHLSFDIRVAHLPSTPVNTFGTTKELAYYGPNTTCNNGLPGAEFRANGIDFCSVCDDSSNCTFDTCDPYAATVNDACVFTPHAPCDDNNNCTDDTCIPTAPNDGCVFTPHAPCNDSDACTDDTCVATAAGDGCIFTPVPPAQHPACEVCGNNMVDPGEDCDLGPGAVDDPLSCCNRFCKYASSTTICRSSGGPCDVTEMCTGSSDSCPVDAFEPSDVPCRPAAGDCDVAEMCTGAGADCPPDAVKPPQTQCADDHDVCTIDECDGTHVACPYGHVPDDTTVCHSATGQCFADAKCEAGMCPANPVKTGASCDAGPNPCVTGQCDENGSCAPLKRAPLAPCGTDKFCDTSLDGDPQCLTRAAKCGDGVVEAGEECDDGLATNGQPTSCCKADCTRRTLGTRCSDVQPEVCDDTGTCVTAGKCGNDIPGEVSLVDGQYAKEACDLGTRNSDQEGGESCCSSRCTLRDPASICRFPDTACLYETHCFDSQDGSCPDTAQPKPADTSCTSDCIVNGHCQNGTCTGTRRRGASRICDADVKIGSLTDFVPPTQTRCREVGVATAAPDASCAAEVTRALGTGLSRDGRALFQPSAVPDAHPLGGPCHTGAVAVISACGTARLDTNVKTCVNAELALGTYQDLCKPPTPCGQALLAFAKTCPKAINRHQALKQNIDAIITGLSLNGTAVGKQAQRKSCRGRKCGRAKQ
jgi:hypothetical protein